ncbi:Death-inducer obliterator 1 [Actinomortierella ambigua]|nr:Death-inducer obliterator 1 [Actinomortierella ambigua]
MSEENGDYSVHLGLAADEMEQQPGLPLDGDAFLNFTDDRIQEQTDLETSVADQSTLEVVDHDAAAAAVAAAAGVLDDGGIQSDVGDLDWQNKVKEIARSALTNHVGIVPPEGLGSHADELSAVPVPVVAFNSLMNSTLLADAHASTQTGAWGTLGHGGYGSLMDMEITKSSPPEDHDHHAFITPNLIFHTQVSEQHTDIEQDAGSVLKEEKEEESQAEVAQPDPMGPPGSTQDKNTTGRKQSPSSSSPPSSSPSPSTAQKAVPPAPQPPTRKSSRARKPSALATLSEEYLHTITVPAIQAIVPERVTRSKKVYCYCQQPDDGEVMIQCDNCRQWFHGACVNITDEDAERIVLSNTKFFCSTCEEKLKAQAESAGGGSGLYMSLSNARDCALPSCVNEARPTNDYCSEECAIKGIELEASQSVGSGSLSNPTTPTVAAAPKLVSRSVVKKAATRVKEPESPKVEQDTVRMTVAKSLTESLLTFVEAEKGELSDADRDKTRQLAVAIEKELYIFTATPGQAGVGKDYKAKYRSLFFNLKDKSNDSLRKRVLSGELAPHDLVRLTPEELANPLLQSIAEEVRKRSIHDSVLTPEQQSFIKRNHKGEVTYVTRTSASESNDPSTVVSEDQAGISAGDDDHESKESERDSDDDGSRDSAQAGTSGGTKPTPPGSPVIEYSLDKLLAKIPSSKRSRDSVLTGGLSSREKRARLLEGSASANYSRPRRDSQDQDASSYLPREPSPYSPSPSPQGSPLLGSTTPPDSPPAFFLEEIEQAAQRKRARVDMNGNDLLPVWQGTLDMQAVASVSVRAVQVGGRSIPGRYAKPFLEMIAPGWTDILLRGITIDGRIPTKAVDDYVSQQLKSTTKDVLLIEFLVDEDTKDPGIDRRKAEFRKLFDYFYEKGRNGVVPNKGRRVKDMYLVPVAGGSTPPPYFGSLLDSARGEIETDCLFGVLVVNKPSDQLRRGHQPPSGKREHHGSSSSHGHSRHEHRPSHSSGPESAGFKLSHRDREQPPPALLPPTTVMPPAPPTPPIPPPVPPLVMAATAAAAPVPPSPPVAAAVTAPTVPTPPTAPMRPVPSLQELQGLVNQLFPPQASKPPASSQPPAVSRPLPYQTPGYTPLPPAPYAPQPPVQTSAPPTSGGPTAAAAAVSAQLGETNAAALLASLPPGFLDQFKKQSPTATSQPVPPAVPGLSSGGTSSSGGAAHPHPPPPMPPPPLPPGLPFLPGMPLPPFRLGPDTAATTNAIAPAAPWPSAATVPARCSATIATTLGDDGSSTAADAAATGARTRTRTRTRAGGFAASATASVPAGTTSWQCGGGSGSGSASASGSGSSSGNTPRSPPRFHSSALSPGAYRPDRDRDRPPKRPGPDHELYRRGGGGGTGGGGGSHSHQRKREWS